MKVKKKPTEYMQVVGGKVPPSIKAQMEVIQKQRGWCQSQLVRYAVERFVKREKAA